MTPGAHAGALAERSSGPFLRSFWETELIESCTPAGLFVVTPKRFVDERGEFVETYSRRLLESVGVHVEFVQDNQSRSVQRGVIRGLHFQSPPHAQAKLVRVIKGAVFDVAVDLRSGSATYGEHFSVELSEENGKQLLIPVGFAHGFCTLVPDTIVAYKASAFYAPECDAGLAWNDPELGVEWPLDGAPMLSPKDASLPPFRDFSTPFT